MAASHMRPTGPDEKPYEPRHSRAEEARDYAERRVKKESRRHRHIAAFIIAAVAVALCVVAVGHGLMKNEGKQPEEQNTTAAEGRRRMRPKIPLKIRQAFPMTAVSS
jgi:type IV secretory pathway VirB10-like protein